MIDLRQIMKLITVISPKAMKKRTVLVLADVIIIVPIIIFHNKSFIICWYLINFQEDLTAELKLSNYGSESSWEME